MRSIKFKDLSKYNDSNSLVWTSLIAIEDELEDINNWFHEIKLIPDNKNLIELRPILDNVRGNKGRSDVLLVFDDNTKISPLVRIQFGEIKWTSDFINNFKNDYIQDTIR